MGGVPLQNGTSSNYILPKASSSILGGVKIGNNISIDSNGVISIADPFSGNYSDLINKPLIPTDISQLTDTSHILSVSPLVIKNQNAIVSYNTASINFTGTGVKTAAVGNDVTVSVDIIGSLDGGHPFTNYGGVFTLDGGSI
jgi:hypothetical protein